MPAVSPKLLHELLEQIRAVLWPRARLRVILHAERGPVGQCEAAIAAVEQADVGFADIVREAFALDREAVVHAGDLDPAVFQPLDRVAGRAVALVHAGRLRANGQAEEL